MVRQGFVSLLTDNDEAYFTLLSNTIESVDRWGGIEVVKTPYNYKFRITLTEGIYFEPLLEAINSMHNTLGIHVEYGKSLKKSATIDFQIEANNPED